MPDTALIDTDAGGSSSSNVIESHGHDKPMLAGTATVARRVPKFDTGSDRPTMNRLQNSFYRRVFLPSLLAGDPVDVQGQSGYGLVLLYDLLDERRKNPIKARCTLEFLVSSYHDSDLPLYAKDVLADFYFLEGDFAAGYAALGVWISPSHHLSLSAHLGRPRLTAQQVLRWGEWRITRKGLRHTGALMDALQSRLDNFQAVHGLSLLEDFWRRVTADKSLQEVAASVEEDVLLRYTGEDVRYFLSEAREKIADQKPPRAFERFPGYEEPIHWPGPWVAWGPHFALLFGLCQTLTRDAENAARDGAKVPRVGEGWVSEMALLRQVQAAFPYERIVHQARPGWLAPQSLDIFLPDHKIAIEYQGAQHSTPVEFFGGDGAFALQQERDARKRSICNKYGCVLIEVHPGYQLVEVVTRVKDAMQNASGGTAVGECCTRGQAYH
ncbi:hypothetical protein [Arthrobacter sulfonylureivorans]|uniref:DUF559 domain-containing protein n=1 Tax=Arthrobacter sulfonylureivorans TaxID=2486855 RepID=A0ABY3W9S0_9MICC|nr:hypothetical protein [Arthrobacter sulfonylureivorans]UNK47099.1 hypothetical protein MNQ99_07085 [Arthrobacter sulfonylureivorans]